MDLNKAIKIQQHARNNVNELQTYMTDLQNWESEMKRKEQALNGEYEQNLPPVRSKIKKEKPIIKPKSPKERIKSADYQAWEKFDVDRACEEVDMADVGPTSLDSKKSKEKKMEKLREEALYEKERGNSFVKLKKWTEAISCYNRAIELVKDDAIYYANRGLCHLKKDSLHLAESDCTEALRLDPTYVKALQRRATAREKLGSLRAASQDLTKVIELEPNNLDAKKQLENIKARMGTKGSKSKSSPQATPTTECKPIIPSSNNNHKPKIIEITSEETAPINQVGNIDKWKDGVDERITVIKPVKKPPHLRSKRSLKSIPIQEIPLGKTKPEKPPTRIKIIEVENDLSCGDTNNNDSNKIQEKQENIKKNEEIESTLESDKLGTDNIVSEKSVPIENMVPPVNSVQFMADWKNYKDIDGARSDYLSIIEPKKIPSIFENALESDVLSDLLNILYVNIDKFKEKTISAYLRELCKVKRFSALTMFLCSKDKDNLTKLLNYCKMNEKCTEVEIADLKNKYEL